MDLDESLTADAGMLADLQEHLFTAGFWLTKPLIAGVHGAALAGGTGLAANAHIVIASDDATFGLTEIRIGLWPFVIFRSVVAAMGERRATELALTGRVFSAAEGLAHGLVHQVAPAAELQANALAVGHMVANSSAAALTAGLAFVKESRGVGVEDVGRMARNYRQQICEGEDFLQRVREFRTKR